MIGFVPLCWSAPKANGIFYGQRLILHPSLMEICCFKSWQTSQPTNRHRGKHKPYDGLCMVLPAYCCFANRSYTQLPSKLFRVVWPFLSHTIYSLNTEPFATHSLSELCWLMTVINITSAQQILFYQNAEQWHTFQHWYDYFFVPLNIFFLGRSVTAFNKCHHKIL